MILVRIVAGVMVGALAFAAHSARADVLEIGVEGARWVVGGPVSASAADAELALPPAIAGIADELELTAADALIVPEHAVAHTHMSGAAVPAAYQAKVAELAARFDLSPALIEALVWQESRWRPGAVSPVGARGLAQLMPGTARELGVDSSDPFANLEGGARYLRAQMDRFGGDVEKALAAYNAGPGRVIKSGGIPRIRETQLYVAAIMGRLSNHSREQ
jgi:soluble lytic murein transglycosylase-like protein